MAKAISFRRRSDSFVASGCGIALVLCVLAGCGGGHDYGNALMKVRKGRMRFVDLWQIIDEAGIRGGPGAEDFLLALIRDPISLLSPMEKRVYEWEISNGVEEKNGELVFAGSMVGVIFITRGLALRSLVRMGFKERPEIYLMFIDEERCAIYGEPSHFLGPRRELYIEPLRKIARAGLIVVFGVDHGFDKALWLEEFRRRGIAVPGGATSNGDWAWQWDMLHN